jgi:hypothetical protein
VHQVLFGKANNKHEKQNMKHERKHEKKEKTEEEREQKPALVPSHKNTH